MPLSIMQGPIKGAPPSQLHEGHSAAPQMPPPLRGLSLPGRLTTGKKRRDSAARLDWKNHPRSDVTELRLSASWRPN